MTTVTVEDVLRKLAEWAEEGHDNVCKSIYPEACRHSRASFAIVEVGNAVADVQRRRTQESRHSEK
jgi:hypothetical protein